MSTFLQLIPRRFERKAVRMAVILFVEKEGEVERYNPFTMDLSSHGVRLQSGVSLTPGQVVEVLSAEGHDPVRARVVWVGKPASEVEGQAGLEFLDPFDIPT